MQKRELERERRRQRRLERLGSNTPRCGTCGESDDRCLDAHHVAQGRYDELTVVQCANCHRKLTDDQNDHPTFVPDAYPFLQRVAHLLLGLADMLRLVADRLVEFGHALIERVRAGAAADSAVQS